MNKNNVVVKQEFVGTTHWISTVQLPSAYDDLDLGKFETKPTDAEWGERFFQMQDPDGYPIVFATPISKND